MQKPQGLAKAACMMAVIAALGTMLALWSPATLPMQNLASTQDADRFRAAVQFVPEPKLASFLCLLVLLWVGWAWRRERAWQPNGGRPAAAVPQILRYRVIRGRST